MDAREEGFEASVIDVLRKLAPGEVATYGEVATEAGFPGAARAVGNVLARNEGLPWWRVVRADGGLVRSHEAEQARLLRGEGFGWPGAASSPMRRRGPATGAELEP